MQSLLCVPLPSITYAPIFVAFSLASVQFGITPLHLAATRGHVDVARALLEKGADTEAKDWVRRPIQAFCIGVLGAHSDAGAAGIMPT